VAPVIADSSDLDDDNPVVFAVSVALVVAVTLALAAVTLLKGKIWTGLFGLFVPVVLVVGAIRLARPASIWARTRYQASEIRPGRPDKMARAVRREQRWHEPVRRRKVALMDAVAGAPDPSDPSPQTR